MPRFYLKLAAVLLGLVFTIAAVIRAQPYDDSELRAFLTPPEGCPAPCFMGIRPGVTTAEEALAILEAHEWVREDIADDTFPSSGAGLNGRIWWRWDDPPAALLGSGYEGYMFIRDEIVESITFWTNIKMGELRLTLGVPDKLTIMKQYSGMTYSRYNVYYVDGNFGFLAVVTCPGQVVWQSHTMMQIYDVLPINPADSDLVIPFPYISLC